MTNPICPLLGLLSAPISSPCVPSVSFSILSNCMSEIRNFSTSFFFFFFFAEKRHATNQQSTATMTSPFQISPGFHLKPLPLPWMHNLHGMMSASSSLSLQQFSRDFSSHHLLWVQSHFLKTLALLCATCFPMFHLYIVPMNSWTFYNVILFFQMFIFQTWKNEQYTFDQPALHTGVCSATCSVNKVLITPHNQTLFCPHCSISDFPSNYTFS